MPIDPEKLMKVGVSYTPTISNINLPSPGDNNYNIDYTYDDTEQSINDKKAENEEWYENVGKFVANVGTGVVTALPSTLGSLTEFAKILGVGAKQLVQGATGSKGSTFAEDYAKIEGNPFSDASKAIKDYANKYIIDPRIDSRTKWGDLEEIVNGVGGSVSEFMVSGMLTGGAGAALGIGSKAMNAVQWINPAFMESYMGVKDNLNKHKSDKEQIQRELNLALNEIENTIFDPIKKQKAIDEVTLSTKTKLDRYNDNDLYTGALISLGLGTLAGSVMNAIEFNPFIKGAAKSSVYDNMANAIGEAITTRQGVKEFAKKAEAGIIKSPLTDFWGAGGNTLKEMGEEGLQDMSLHIGDDYSNQKIATGDYSPGKGFESLANMMFSDKFLKTLASGAFGGISMQLVGGAFQESGIGAKFGGAETTKKQNEDLRKMATIAIENNENFSNMAMEIDRKMFEAKKIDDLRKNGQVIEAQEAASSLIHEHLQESFKKGLFQFTKNNIAELKENAKPLQEELKTLKEKQQDLLASPTATESEKTTVRNEIFQKEAELANIETLSQHTEGFEKKYEEYNKKTKNDDLTHLAMQLDFNERSLLESENSYRKRSEEIAMDLRQQIVKIRDTALKPGSKESIENEALVEALERLIENPLNTEEAFTNLSNKINKGQNIIDDADLEIIAKRKSEVLSDLDTISRQMNDLKANGADIETIKPLYQQQIELSKYLNQLKGDEIAINERKADDIKELEESLRKNSSLYGALKDNHDSLVASRLAKKRRISLNEFKNKILSDKIVQQGAIDSLTKKKESIEFTKMMMTEIQLLRQNQLLLNFGHENYLEEFDKEKDLSQEMLGQIIAEEQSKKEEEQLKKRDAIKKKIDDEIALRFKNRPSIIKILEERKKLEADIKAIEDELKKLEAEAKTKKGKDAKEKLEAEKKAKEEELKKKLEAEAKAILAEKELIAKEENVNFLRSVGINVSMADSDELILNIIKYSEDLSNSFLDYFNPDGSIRNDIGATSLPAYSDAAYVISDLLFLIDELKGKGIGDVNLMLKELSDLVKKYNYTDNFDDAIGSVDRVRIEELLKEFGLLVKDIAKIPRETSNLVEAEKFNAELKEAEELRLKAEEEAKNKAEEETKKEPPKTLLSDIEAKKADIEMRRQRSLSEKEWSNSMIFGAYLRPGSNGSWVSTYFQPSTGTGIGGESVRGNTKEEVIDKINAKYDAELAALESTKPIETKTIENQSSSKFLDIKENRYNNTQVNRLVRTQEDGSNIDLTQEEIKEIEQIIEQAKKSGWNKDRLYRQLTSMKYIRGGGSILHFKNYLEDRLSGKTNIKVTSNYNFFKELEKEINNESTKAKTFEEQKSDIEKRREEEAKLEAEKTPTKLKESAKPTKVSDKNEGFSQTKIEIIIGEKVEIVTDNSTDGVTTIVLKTKKGERIGFISTSNEIDGYEGITIGVNSDYQNKGISKHLYNLALASAKSRGLKGLFSVDNNLKTEHKSKDTRKNFETTKSDSNSKLNKTVSKQLINELKGKNAMITLITDISDSFEKQGAIKYDSPVGYEYTDKKDTNVKSKDIKIVNGIDLSNMTMLRHGPSKEALISEQGVKYGLIRVIEGSDGLTGDGTRYKGRPDYFIELGPNSATGRLGRSDGSESSTTIKELELTKSEQKKISAIYKFSENNKEKYERLREVELEVANRVLKEEEEEKKVHKIIDKNLEDRRKWFKDRVEKLEYRVPDSSTTIRLNKDGSFKEAGQYEEDKWIPFVEIAQKKAEEYEYSKVKTIHEKGLKVHNLLNSELANKINNLVNILGGRDKLADRIANEIGNEYIGSRVGLINNGIAEFLESSLSSGKIENLEAVIKKVEDNLSNPISTTKSDIKTTESAVTQITEKIPEEKEAEKKIHKSPEKLNTSKLDGAKSKLFNVNVDIATMSITELDKDGKPVVDSTGSVVIKPQIFEQHRNILRGDLIMKPEIRNNIVIGRIGLTSVNMSSQELEEVDKQMIDEKITKLSESLKAAFGEAIDFKFLSEDSFYRSLGESKDERETVANAYIRDGVIYINSNGNIDESTLIHEFSHPIVMLIHENIPVLYGDLLEASKKFLTEAELKEIIDLYGENYKHLNDEIIVHAIQYAFKDKNRNGSEVVKNFREGIREEIKSPIFAAVSEVTSLQSIVKLITEGDAKLKNALSSTPSSEKQKAVISKLDSEITEITNNKNNRC